MRVDYFGGNSEADGDGGRRAVEDVGDYSRDGGMFDSGDFQFFWVQGLDVLVNVVCVQEWNLSNLGWKLQDK